MSMEGNILFSDTDGLENLRVFAQALPLKARLSNLATKFVTRRCIELIEPALIFPTRRAHIDALVGESENSALKRGAVKCHEGSF
jgi:hypothetical protein